MALVAMMSFCLMTACSKDDDKDEPAISVAFGSLTANGSATETTTLFTLTFDKDIKGLTADDLTLTPGTTGATKGALTSKGNGTYELAITGITAPGEVTVAIGAKEGYTFPTTSKMVTVFYVAPVTPVAFSSLEANGSATETTTLLTLTFDKDITGLTAEDLILTPGTTGATKGALTSKGSGKYELTLTGITATGEVAVAVTKAGYAIEPPSKSATLYVAPVLITNNPLIAAIEAAASVSFTKNANGDIDVKTNKAKIEGITELFIYGKQLTSLEGIENFTNLTTLNCNGNKLTTLNVSALTKLTDLACSTNKLTELDLSALTNLTKLNCKSNLLTTLNVLPLTKLTSLVCSSNKLTTLDVSPLTALTNLECESNELTTFNASSLTQVKTMFIDKNKMSTLDVSGCTNLEKLSCQENELSTLDVSNLSKLSVLRCYNNKLTALNILHTKINSLECNNNRLSTLDVSTLSGFNLNNQIKLAGQTSDGTTAQTLNVTVSQVQKDRRWPEFDSNNPGVILVVKP